MNGGITSLAQLGAVGLGQGTPNKGIDRRHAISAVLAAGVLSPRLLQYSNRTGPPTVPAESGNVLSDAVTTRNLNRGGAWEPVSGTDDTTALNNLIKSVSENGGGTVVLPVGTTLARINLLPGVNLVGAGRRQTSVMLPNGYNTHVIRTVPSTGDNAQLPYRTTIRDLTVDGNRWNQSVPYHRGSVENYGNHAHGIWFAPGAPSSIRDEGLDRHYLVEDVTIRDVYGSAIYARSCPGENRFNNVVAWRPGIGFVSSPDSMWSSCTVGEAEFYGVFNMHGSTTWTNSKVFRTGAWVNPYSQTVNTSIRRASSGWHLQGYGNQVVIAACSSQNNGGYGLKCVSGAGANVQMQVDANNLIATDTGQWGQMNWDGNTIADQKYGRDGTTPGTIFPGDFAGAYLDTTNSIFSLNSMVGSEQNPGSYYGWQKHAVEFGPKAKENTLSVAHHSNIPTVRAAGSVINPAYQGGLNRVIGNSRVLDETVAP